MVWKQHKNHRHEPFREIVFATGYSQFALQAFELEAFDYILKPYDEERIAKPSSAFSTVLCSGKTVPPPGKS